MANEEHLKILKQGVGVWNEWRERNPKIHPDPSDEDFLRAGHFNADLSSTVLKGCNLCKANLIKTNFSEADLRGADLRGADLRGALLYETNLSGADLRGADLSYASLACADLSEADLSDVTMKAVQFGGDADKSADLSGAILKGSSFTEEGEGFYWSGFLELASTIGLETAVFDDPRFLPMYIEQAFEYAHREALEERDKFPDFFEATIEKIRALRSLFRSEDPPQELITVVKEITTELIKYLKAHPKALYEIRPRQFEELVAEILASYGWQVQLTPPTKDGGYDIFAISKDESGLRSSWIVECKKYREDRKVGVDIARAVYAVKADFRVSNALLATTSYFTRGVKEFKASRYDFSLRDLQGILEWMNEYKPNPEGRLYIKDNKLVVGEDE